MKYVVAVIKPQRLDAVRDALTALGVLGMTVSDVKGYGRQKGQSEVYRGEEYEIAFVPKIKLEIAVEAAQSADVVDAIANAANSGNIGDGKIFVLDLAEAVRIRTGETGGAAL